MSVSEMIRSLLIKHGLMLCVIVPLLIFITLPWVTPPLQEDNTWLYGIDKCGHNSVIKNKHLLHWMCAALFVFLIEKNCNWLFLSMHFSSLWDSWTYWNYLVSEMYQVTFVLCESQPHITPITIPMHRLDTHITIHGLNSEVDRIHYWPHLGSQLINPAAFIGLQMIRILIMCKK